MAAYPASSTGHGWPPGGVAVPHANRYLVLLVAINLFNYIDRQVLSAVLPRMQLDGTLFAPGDPNAQLKVGLLTSAFMAAYMVCSPIFGWLDGRRARRWIILGVGVTLWSIASGASGLAQGYAMLLFTRCLVGVGEGAYGPVAAAMLADMYPDSKRGKVMALFNMAIPVGSALGFLIGAKISGAFDDWRPAFLFTFSGLFLGLFCFLQKESPRPPRTGGTNGPGYKAVLAGLKKNRSFVFCCAGMTAITFVIGGVAAWAPVYLFQREAKFAMTAEVVAKLSEATPNGGDVPVLVAEKLRPLADGNTRTYTELRKEIATRLSEAESIEHAKAIYTLAATADSPKAEDLTIILGAMIVLGGISATAVGAILGEWLRPRVRGAYFLVIAAGAFFAIPSYLGLLYAPLPWGWLCIFLCVFGLFLHTGPAFTILANVTKSDERATAFAINILVIHLLGDAISPTLIGAVADFADLQTAFAILTAFIVVGGILWLLGAKYLESDEKAVKEST